MALPNGENTCEIRQEQFRQMNTSDEGLHITFALTATWLPWICLLMAVLVWLSCILQPQYLRRLVSNSFAAFTFNTTGQMPSIGSQAAQWLFNTGIPAICIYSLVTQSAVYGTQLFALVLLLSVATDLFRALTAIVVQYTFRLGKLTGMGYVRYFSLRSLYTYLQFGLVLLIDNAPFKLPYLIALGITTSAYLIILGVQWGKLFCSSALEVISLLIYLITVEVLPTLLLYEAGKQLYLSAPF